MQTPRLASRKHHGQWARKRLRQNRELFRGRTSSLDVRQQFSVTKRLLRWIHDDTWLNPIRQSF